VHTAIQAVKPDMIGTFLGREHKLPPNNTEEIGNDFQTRIQGTRIKHRRGPCSIKMYDKAGSVLRVETTIANPSGFKVFRPLSTDPSGQLAWLPMRKGIADMHRRAQVSQRANDNYLDALSKVDDATPLSVVFDEVGHAVVRDGHRSRAIRIGDRDDIALLKAICRGEFATNGMRNRDLQRLLHPVCSTREVRRKVSAKIGRRLRLLRAHGLIRKVQKSHRYTMTEKGHLLAAALFAARDATTKQLLRDAA